MPNNKEFRLINIHLKCLLTIGALYNNLLSPYSPNIWERVLWNLDKELGKKSCYKLTVFTTSCELFLLLLCPDIMSIFGQPLSHVLHLSAQSEVSHIYWMRVVVERCCFVNLEEQSVKLQRRYLYIIVTNCCSSCVLCMKYWKAKISSQEVEFLIIIIHYYLSWPLFMLLQSSPEALRLLGIHSQNILILEAT